MTRCLHPGRRGFTRWDLLAIMLVLGTCSLLLTPAVNQVREAADKMTCASNLKQLGIATHNYHSDFDRLPAGYWGHTFSQQPLNPPVAGKMKGINPEPAPFALAGQQISCLTALLPYIEQDHVYKQLLDRPEDPNDGLDFGLQMWNQNPWWTVPSNRMWGQTRFRLLHCPSDTLYEPTTEGVFLALHCEKVPTGGFMASPAGNVLGRTNYVGCMGTRGYAMVDNGGGGFVSDQPYSLYRGMLCNRSRLTLGQVTVKDGTANTILFGETLGGNGKAERDYAFSWFGCGALPTGWGLGQGGDNAEASQAAAWYKFSSRHGGVVQFCFGDASVRGLRRGMTGVPLSPDWWILQQLAGFNDGRFDDASILYE